jgi:L-2,4-diaminobutyrate transaminase
MTPSLSRFQRTGLSLEAADQQSFLHPFTSIPDLLQRGPRVMVEGRGMRIRDSHQREYLDAMAGLWCVNVGYGREELVEAMASQSRRLSYFHAFNSMSIDTSIRCAERLVSLAPANMSKVFFGSSGSDANETQIKLIWLYNNLRGKPKKKKILARTNAYHGSTIATASLTGIASMHALYDLPIDRFSHVSRPLFYWDAEKNQSEREFSAALADELDQRIRE